MGILKQDNQENKVNAIMKKYHLEDVSPEIGSELKDIGIELAGTGMLETGMKLSMAKAEEQVKISYLNAIMRQNFIIIKLLDEIAKK